MTLLKQSAYHFDLSKNKFDAASGSLFSADQKYLIVYYKSPVTGWLILKEIPVAMIVKDSRQILDITLIMSLFALAMDNVSAVSEESMASSEFVASLSQHQTTASDETVKLSNELQNLSHRLLGSLNQFQIHSNINKEE